MLMVDHLLEVSSSGSHLVLPVMGYSHGMLSLLDVLSSLSSPVFEVLGHPVDVTVSVVDSFDGGMDGTDGSDVMGVGSAHGGMGVSSSSLGVSSVLLGNGVSSDGSVVSSDSSLEGLGESVHEVSDVPSVVVGLEVGEGVVVSAGSESHVLLDESGSGSVGGIEGGPVVEERKISEVGVLDNLDVLLVEGVVTSLGSDCGRLLHAPPFAAVSGVASTFCLWCTRA